MYSLFLLSLYFVPLFLAFILCFKKLNEKTIYLLNHLSLIPPFLVSLILFIDYFLRNFIPYELSFGELHLGLHHFSFNLFFDELTMTILLLTGYLSILVNKFSYIYLHREINFQRFFLIINLFVFGLYVLAMAGTLDLFFAGWEIVGLSSFLLIGFYYDRTRPSRNAFRIFSIYRFCDVGLLFSAILSHVLWDKSDHFYFLIQKPEDLSLPFSYGWLMTMNLLILLTAIGKSAQFPFINWPARAMEGPTPSSAIFYGALSIHCGVFLLYRAYPLLNHSHLILSLIFLIGLLSTITATIIGRVQANIKGQIAYASVAQIGVMFMEIALGLKTLVLIHLVLHALFRCYQLLISPSIVVDHIKSMEYVDQSPYKKMIGRFVPTKLRTTLFTFAQQEGFLSISERGFFPFPIVRVKIWARNHIELSTLIFILIGILIFLRYESMEINTFQMSAHLFAILNLFLSLHCILSLKHPLKIWRVFIFAQFSFVLANFFHDPHNLVGIKLYLLSALPCLTIGYMALSKIPQISLKRYNGLHNHYSNEYRLILISFIGLAGYPFTTIFWAEDIIFAEIVLEAPSILFMSATSLMLNGFIIGKILVKTFWGHPMATYR